jgi:hypothetical protein
VDKKKEKEEEDERLFFFLSLLRWIEKEFNALFFGKRKSKKNLSYLEKNNSNWSLYESSYS